MENGPIYQDNSAGADHRNRKGRSVTEGCSEGSTHYEFIEKNAQFATNLDF